MEISITEALAELRTIEKRLTKKVEFVLQNLWGLKNVADPLAPSGGRKVVIDREMQAIDDLQARSVAIRDAITASNRSTTVKVQDKERTVHEWLIWRREHSENVKGFLGRVLQNLENAERQVKDKFMQVSTSAEKSETVPMEIETALNKKDVVDEIEELEVILGELDGKLTMSNSRTMIDV